MSNEIRLILVDDNHLCRCGLTELLSKCYGFTVLGATGNADELMNLLREGCPDLLVMDLRMKPVSGLEMLKLIRKEGFLTPVLILTVSDAESDLADALRAGVRGYLLKDMASDDVIDAIRRVYAGELVVAPAMTSKMIRILQNKPQELDRKDALKLLTGRQYEILQLLTQGESNNAIAITLGISNDTVKQHVRHIFTKLNLTSRVEAAVLFAVEQKTFSDNKSHFLNMPEMTSMDAEMLRS